jgi:hypothetical protein
MSARYLSPERMIEAAGASFAYRDEDTQAGGIADGPHAGFFARLRAWAARFLSGREAGNA